jgi:mono/diheme cytochrome c family protein
MIKLIGTIGKVSIVERRKMHVDIKKTAIGLVMAALCTLVGAKPSQADGNGHGPPLEVLGRQLFEEPKGEFGVACSDCHVRNKGQLHGITPEHVAWLAEHRPQSPLFNPKNSNDAFTGGDPEGSNFSQLRDNTAVMVRMDLPNNVVVISYAPGALVFTGPSDQNGGDTPDGPITQIGVFRNIQTISNVALSDGLAHGEGSNARLGWAASSATYKEQAEGAFLTHAGVSIELTQEQAAALQAYQTDQFSSGKARKLEKNPNYTRNLPSADNAVELAGKTAFIEKCMQCHGGRELNQTSENHVVENAFGLPHGNRLEGNFGDIHEGDPLTFPPFSIPPNNSNPTFVLMFISTDPSTGAPAPDVTGQPYRIVVTSDPASLFEDLDGFGNAQPCAQLISNCLINNPPPGVNVPATLRPLSRIVSLWDFGEKLEEGFNLGRSGQFHTIRQLNDKAYTPLFAVTAIGLNQPDLALTEQELQGLDAWLPKL